jgi:hypothetical protein
MLSSWASGGGVHCHTNDQPAFFEWYTSIDIDSVNILALKYE